MYLHGNNIRKGAWNMSELSSKDYEILDFILEKQNKMGYPPTVREMCEAVGLSSTATIHARLKKLEKHGYLIKENAKNRSIKVVNYKNVSKSSAPVKIEYQEDEYLKVPVYGKVTAGVPITAIEDVSNVFPLPMSFARNKDLFMLRVQGESMINAAILDGDFIIVEKTPVARNGEIVVALIDGENATVKTFYKENGCVRLQPENDTMEPIIVDNVEILGKVVGVFRKM